MRNADLRPVGRQSRQTIHLRDALMFHGLGCLGLWRWRCFYKICFLEIIPDWGNILAKAASIMVLRKRVRAGAGRFIACRACGR